MLALCLIQFTPEENAPVSFSSLSSQEPPPVLFIPETASDSLIHELVEQRVPYGLMWIAVAKQETSWPRRLGVSRLHNFFGMMRRYGIPINNPERSQRYQSTKECVWDLKRKIYEYPPEEDEEFVEYLVRINWNPNPGYPSKIRYWLKELNI